MFVYFEVYDPATDPANKASSVAATLSFYRRARRRSPESVPCARHPNTGGAPARSPVRVSRRL